MAYAGYQPQTGISTPFATSGIYTPQMTRQATNQAVAGAQASASPYDLSKRTRTAGFSAGLGNARNMLPGIVAGAAGAADRRATVPFNDYAANAKYNLAGQVAQDSEGLGWGNISQGNSEAAMSRNNQRQQLGWQLLNQIMNS